jgi:hypothetical protein
MRWLKGDLDGAIEAMQLAVGAASPQDAESAAWVNTRLASYEFQAGRVQEAEQRCALALSLQQLSSNATVAGQNPAWSKPVRRGRGRFKTPKPTASGISMDVSRGATRSWQGDERLSQLNFANAARAAIRGR